MFATQLPGVTDIQKYTEFQSLSGFRCLQHDRNDTEQWHHIIVSIPFRVLDVCNLFVTRFGTAADEVSIPFRVLDVCNHRRTI